MTEIPQRASLVAQVADLVRRDLHTGARSRRLPSERELAERFQVSRTTLRKALQSLARDGWIRAEPGQAWVVVARPKRRTASDAPRTIGILCLMPLDQAPQFLLFLIERLRERLNAAGWKVEVREGWEFHQQHSRHVLAKVVEETRARLWVLSGGKPEVLRWFEERNVPAFLIGKPPPPFQFPYLSDDLRVACRHAVGLLASRGHRRLVWLRPRATARARDDALKGFQEGIELFRRRGEISARIVYHVGPPDHLQPVLGKLMESSSRPTALLVDGARYTLTTLTCLTYTGVRVPQDVSVVSIGHQPYLDLVKPSIAHYEIDGPAYARRLCRMVLQCASSPNLSVRSALVMPRFRDGESLGRV